MTWWQAVDAQKELSTMMAHLAVKHQATQREVRMTMALS